MACPICSNPTVALERPHTSATKVDCNRCGLFSLIGTAQHVVPSLNLQQRSRLSHKIRHAQGRDTPPEVIENELAVWGINEQATNPKQQLNYFIEWLALKQTDYAKFVYVDFTSLHAYIGATIDHQNYMRLFAWLFTQPELNGLFERIDDQNGSRLRLTMKGWILYEHLQTQSAQTNTAFMAMKFHQDIFAAYETCFQPAAMHAGFDLTTLNANQPAGLIDDQLRVAIRRSRFVIADLTFHNNGAYWEAGFAEGLGRPVIYTCRKAEWDIEKTHFDTNHLATVIWDDQDWANAGTKLSAMIRATFPN